MSIGTTIKKITGNGIMTIGFLLWLISALVCFVWTLFVLYSFFGWWTIFVGLFLAPVTYMASIFIVWFASGVFPIILLIPYLASFVGLIIAGLGGKLSETKAEE